jgi:flagellar biosynthesis/type III secretory pathway protein FliH
MSSSELIIRRSQAAYTGDGAYTADGLAELQLPPFPAPGTESAGRVPGMVIRGQRFGLGSGVVMARDSSGRTGSDERHAAGFAAGASAAEIAANDRSLHGLASSALLQVDLRELQQRIEDRAYAMGRARAETELAAAIEATGAMAARIEALAPHESTAVAHALVALSTAIAGRIIGAELHLDSTILVRALESAVAAINGSPEARVLLHPDQLGPVQQAWEATHGSAFLGKRWTFEADASLPPGGCVLRYEHGFVAAGLEAQLELITSALEEAIPGLRAARPADAEAGDA